MGLSDYRRVLIGGTEIISAYQGNALLYTAGRSPVVVPQNTAAPAITGQLRPGEQLVVSDGTWTGEVGSYGYRWLRGGTAISGATSASYLLTTDDTGAAISAQVRAFGPGGSSGWMAATGGGLVTGLPVLTLTLSPATLTEGETATVTGTLSGGASGVFSLIEVSIGGISQTLSGTGMSRSFIASDPGTLTVMAAVTLSGQTISASLSGEVREADGTEPVPLPTDLTLADFSRDRVLFDTGAARGVNLAPVPLSGRAAPGTVIEGRVLRGDGSAATTWATIATAGSTGNWTGTLNATRDAQWLRPEVRLAANPSVTATTQNRFGAGHVFALWGQSEIARMLTSYANGMVSSEVLSTDDVVQIIWGSDLTTTPTVKHLTAADSHTPSIRAMANVLMAERPGEKFAVVFQAVAGTHFSDLVDDSQNDLRTWAKDKAVHDFATADGQHVGVAAMSWFAAPRNLGPNYGEVVFGLMTGRSTSGAALSRPRSLSAGSSTFTVNHDWTELYDYAHTRWLPYGPHRFDPSLDLQAATLNAEGNSATSLTAIQQCRDSWRTAMASASGAGVILPMGLELNGYLNGFESSGAWTDTSHPGRLSMDGNPLWSRLTAHALLQGAGLADWQVPEFDRCEWQADGSYIEVWSSAGAITTLRRARNEAALGNTWPHWTDVMGFEINNQPARRAELVAGRVRIYPNSGSFSASDVLSFGRGGASGMLEVPEDYFAGVYRNYPIVNLGAAQVAGIPLRPMPDPSVLSATAVRPAAWEITPRDGAALVVSSPAVSTPVVTARDGAATVQE